MPFYSDDIIEEVRTRNDIVVRFITKNQAPFPCPRVSRCITASVAGREGMFSLF